MDFNSFLNEAPNYSPERLKAHGEKAEAFRQSALQDWKKCQKFLELKTLGGQQLDNAEESYEDLQKSIQAYFDHLKIAP